jgi:hypothetical protein
MSGSIGDNIYRASGVVAAPASGGDNTPSFFAYVSADTAVTDSTLTIMNADTESWDTDGAYDNSAYKFTVPADKGGKYRFTIGYRMFHTSTGIFYWSSRLYVNGGYFIDHATQISPNDVTYIGDILTATLDLSATDYVEPKLYVDNANNTDMSLRGGHTPIVSWFSGYKLL